MAQTPTGLLDKLTTKSFVPALVTCVFLPLSPFSRSNGITGSTKHCGKLPGVAFSGGLVY